MKKIILTLAIAILSIAAIGQTYEVYSIKIIDDSNAEWIVQKSKEETQRIVWSFAKQMQKSERINDTIYYENVIDLYLDSLWSTHYALKAFFSEPDTISIEKIGSDYYQDGDINIMALNLERDSLISRYDELKIIHGKWIDYQKEYQPMKERYETLQDWVQQILSQ